MENLVHKPLRWNDEIRLIKLFPRREGEHLIAELLHVRMSNTPEYEAVSYTWATLDGDTSLCRDITIFPSKKKLQITKNARFALARLRHEHSARLLWMDSICIDQTNLKERSHQVKQMTEIYGNAQKVLVYLQPLPELQSIARLQRLSVNIQDHGLYDLLYDGRISEEVRQDANMFISNSWFRRMWVLQEIALARSAVVYYGSCQLDWKFLASFPTTALDDGLIVWAQSPDDKRILPPVLRIRKSRQAEPKDLVDLLLATRTCDATDPRDKVYALLWCFRNSGTYLLEPDYSKSVTEVYREATMLCIKTSNNLRVLEMAPGLSAPAESWIPDFASPNDNHKLDRWRKDLGLLASQRFSIPSEVEEGRGSSTELVAFPIQLPKSPLLALHVRAWRVGMIAKAIVPSNGSGKSYPIILKEYELEVIDEVLENLIPDTLAPRMVSWKSASKHTPVTICEVGLPQGFLHRIDILPLGESFFKPLHKRKINRHCQDTYNHVYRLLGRHGKHRKLFTTKLHIGIGPLDTVEGDVVYYLQGLEKPLILRKHEKNFVVVGECLLLEVSSRGICTACGQCVRCGHEQFSTELAQRGKKVGQCELCSLFGDQMTPRRDMSSIVLI